MHREREDGLLYVNKKELFNTPLINYEDGIEYQSNYLNDENIICRTINETIDIMHRQLRHIEKNRVGYMINEGLSKLSYTDVDKFYLKYIRRTCALGKSHNMAHNKCHPK